MRNYYLPFFVFFTYILFAFEFTTNGKSFTLYQDPDKYIIHAGEPYVEYADSSMIEISVIYTLSDTKMLYVIEKSSNSWPSIKQTFSTYCDSVRWIPVYNVTSSYDDGGEYYLFNQIIVKFDSTTTPSQIDSIALAHDLGTSTDMIPSYLNLFDMDSDNPRNPLYLSMELDSLSLINWAVPVHSITSGLADEYYDDYQWNLNNTGQIDENDSIDINAPEAWTIEMGSEDIIVAILDNGVNGNDPEIDGDMAHEDFDAGQILLGMSNASQCDTDTQGRPCSPISAHGMGCAGIIGAQHNEVGVKGIAPGVKIRSITMWVPESNLAVVNAIDYAWNNADILSCSWNMMDVVPDDGEYYDPAIDEAYQEGAENGRGGLGCIFVHATGNWGVVGFPPNYVEEVIGVGAATHSGQRAGYSANSSLVDIVAPSKDVTNTGIATLDPVGTFGLSNSDYNLDFGGTSAACPHVAAVAALILSVNPDLTHTEVKTVLYDTAIELDSVADWDGAGLVDAFGALMSLFCCGDVDKDRYEDTEENGLDNDDSYLISDFIMETDIPDIAQEELGDHNDDDVIDVLDAVAIVGHKNNNICESVSLTKSYHNNSDSFGDIVISSGEKLNRSGEIEVVIEISSEVPVEGFQFNLEFDTGSLNYIRHETTEITDSYVTYSKIIDDHVRVLSFNDGVNPIPQGNHQVISLYFNDNLSRISGNIDFQLNEKVMATSDGDRINISSNPYLPEVFILHPAQPNPFNPITTIQYDLPEESYISIQVYDVMGRQVAELVNGVVSAGYRSVVWDASRYSSGIYFVKLITPGYTETQKVMLLK
ncbi:MAG: S8 family peptidase [Candidatus Marinimicrobia bacterium]|nr:S8 family peptidase [Candidatus Neomarinimicrobiota bacterium]